MAKGITTLVTRVLKDNPEARSNDLLFLLDYYQKSGLDLSDEQREAWLHLPSPWNVIRTKKRLQQLGRFNSPL